MSGRHLRVAIFAYSLPALAVGAFWGWTARDDDRLTGGDIWTLALMPILAGFCTAVIEGGMVNAAWFKAEQRREERAQARKHGRAGRRKRPGLREFAAEASWQERRYGARHQVVREHWRRIVSEHGATCSERVCVLPTREILCGAPFDLAHDHEAGGDHDYLGPAHPECNRAEAEARLGFLPGNADSWARVSPNAIAGHDTYGASAGPGDRDPWAHLSEDLTPDNDDPWTNPTLGPI